MQDLWKIWLTLIFAPHSFTNSTPCGVHVPDTWHLLCLQMNACESRQFSAGIIVIPNTWHPQCLSYPKGKKIGCHRRLYLGVCLHIDHLPLCTYLTLDICCCLQMNATESRRFSAGICIGSGNQVGILFAKFGLFRLYCVPPKQTSLLSISTTNSSQR